MINSGLIAEGSVRGIIGGTHFNRCKNVHAVVALSFKVMHFNRFLESYEKLNHNEKISFEEIVDNLCYENETHQTEAAKLQLKDIIDRYKIFNEETRKGVHGSTARFVHMYIEFIENYQLFEYSIRTNDLDLYIYAARKMCVLFFVFNHQNYARWLTKNIDDLVNMEQTHPGLKKYFEDGALSVRRTNKNFCRSPVDLTLEQTINANAANKLTGISSFTNSIYARQRWSETHTARKAIITHLIEYLKLTEPCENSTNARQNTIFNNQVQKFTEEVNANINPFSEDLCLSKLFNLTTGKAASDDTKNFLLNAESNGAKQMQTFIEECRNDGERFQKPIKRNRIQNFLTDGAKRKVSSKKDVDEVKYERNILGQIACLAMQNSVDLNNILSFPLTIVPQSISHFDGTIIQHSKPNELLSLLLAKVETDHRNISGHDVEINDGFYVLNGLKDSPSKFGLFATFFLKYLCKTAAREIHVIFDETKSPSLKDLNLKSKEELVEQWPLSSIKINGENQERVSSLGKCLLHHEFREELVKFLIKYWSTSNITDIIGEKRIFVSFREVCHIFCKDCEQGKMLASFKTDHIEVESKIIFHLHKIRATDILIRTSKPEKTLVYLIYHMQFWTEGAKNIWMEIGDSNKNTLQQIDVSRIYSTLNPIMVQALPAWYIFTGSDYESSFFGKGRRTCFKYFEKNQEYQIAFANFGLHEPTERDLQLIEKYTCQLYNAECVTVNDARVKIFQKAYTVKNGINYSKKGKKMIQYLLV